MNLRTTKVRRFFPMAMMVIGATLIFGQNARDLVNGNLIQFNKLVFKNE